MRSPLRPPVTFRVVPGVLPDGTAESLEVAMAEAHDALPAIPGTRVHVALWPRREGLAQVAEHFGPEAVQLITERLDELGPEAVITFCSRIPHSWTPAGGAA